MKDELELKLAEDFPFMRSHENKDEQKSTYGHIHNTFRAFGCECGDGWFKLLHSLCTEITAAYESAGLPADIVVDQIKEKFGTLRFYYHHLGHDKPIHAFDFMGQGSIRIKQAESDVQKEVAQIVDYWEIQSANVCEICGGVGELRTDFYWVLTLCDDCYLERKREFEKRKRK